MKELSFHDDYLLYRLGSEDSSSKKITPSQADEIAEETGRELRLVPWLEDHNDSHASS